MDILLREDWHHFTARKPVIRKGYPLLYSNKDGSPFFAFTRYALTGCRQQPRPDHGLAPLTDLQADALDTIEFIAAESSLALPQRRGSIFLISNRRYLHAHTAYANDLSDTKRHLIKINLNDSEYGHELPEKLNDRWGHFFKYPHELGKWMVEKNQPESFVSAHQFDQLYFDETGTHSSS
ncbi:hypothetical protein BP6252_08901 [Coleophoma cylindrospora]|uniref:Uncharacterized protein n=1 Tax=Coleophoma cylindrospora TaxID=1849047 RepID=A0A3D8R0H2_9HELO|nr:hypothetical protein BP6252_08901 [Coleophoma cylindrospora]